jgi:ABC-2 type transport system ATP-binding protein
MNDTVILVDHITKDYGGGRGVFDLNFEVKRGEIFGFVGTNGSGKTTTIRQMMGFLKPTSGSITVLGRDAWAETTAIKCYTSYVPGEIAFPDLPTGTAFLKVQAEYLGVTDMNYANRLIRDLQLDPSANLKRMSKGMKQKTAIVAALMGDRDILILDEPTTGLDPLMREVFISAILEEKARGKTVFMSSHIYQEIEDTCDRVALIRDGRIIDIADMNEIRHHNVKTFRLGFRDKADYDDFRRKYDRIEAEYPDKLHLTVDVDDSGINAFFTLLSGYSLAFLSEIKYTLEKHFADILKGAPDNEK